MRLDLRGNGSAANISGQFSPAAIAEHGRKLIHSPEFIQEWLDSSDFVDSGSDKINLGLLLSMMTEGIQERLQAALSSGAAYHLPADRTGIMHSHQVLVSTLIQNAATAGIPRSEPCQPCPAYSRTSWFSYSP